MMEKQELESKQKAFAASLVSIVYAFVMQLTQGLSLVPNHPEYAPYINASIFVPAIASILFGKLIGATGAAGGRFLDASGTTLLASTKSGGVAAQSVLTGLDLTHLILMASDFIGAWVVGSLTEKPAVRWDSFAVRFQDMQTWSRLFQNTLGSIIGLGMFDSLLSSYATAVNQGLGVDYATSTFVKIFFLNSIVLVIFIPITLLLYEFGDIIVQMRALAKDKSLRKVAKNVVKEEAVTIISTRLTETALAENIWTPILVKFRANLDQEVTYKIEAVSTANYYPAFDNTKPLKKGEIWEQKFFIMSSKQKNVNFKVRITPAIQNIGEVQQQNIPETIANVTAKSYNPNSNSATLVLFSIINTIMVGASVLWNNLLQFNVDSALTSLKQSWVVILSTGGLEAVIMVPVLMYLRRRWAMADSESLTVGFGTDLSERSQKIYQSIGSNVGHFFEYFGTKLQRSMKLFLVFVTTVSVLLLGLEGYNDLTIKGYTIMYSSQLLIIGALAIVLWLGGYKGIDILRSAGLIEEEKYEIQEGKVVKKFKPEKDFLANAPNEVTFTITNPTKQNGIRFRFLSQDTVSPPLVEMPVPPGGRAVFKTSITPRDTGTRNIMAVVYPLFDENGGYIDENAAEPYTHQYVNYQVQSETQIGLSKDQESKLKKLLVLVGGLLVIIYGGGVFAQQVVGGQSTYTLLSNNTPYLLALQVPFVWAYFYIQNKSKLIKGEMESIIEQINAMDNLAKDMNDKLDKSVLKSRAFTKNINSVLQTTLSSVAGLSAMKHLNDIISKQIEDSLGDDFTQQISKVVKDEDMTFFQGISSQIISDNFSYDFQKVIAKEKEATPQMGSSEENTDETGGASPVDNNELKNRIKARIMEDYRDKIKKQTSKKLSEELKKKSSDSFVNTYKDELTANLKKSLSKEFKKQIKDEQLINDIEEKIFELIGPEVQEKILEELNKTVFNREILSSIAENLDTQLGTNIMTEFEDSIGTAMESKMTDTIKQQLEVKYEKEVQVKLEVKIKKLITKELNKRGDRIINDLLSSKLTTDIENKMISTLQSSIADKLDSVVDMAIDNSLVTMLA